MDVLIYFFIVGTTVLLIREYSSLYAISGWFPQTVRRGWIRSMHHFDFINWRFYDELLTAEFPYFNLLDDEEKSEFLVRVIDIKNYMVFDGRDGVKLDNRKLALLSASMAEITFGFKDYRLYTFKKIIIYPDIFYSKFLDADVKGITYGTGYVFLSWKDFESGYANSTNKINLGLHEFAHALMMQKSNRFKSFVYDDFCEMGNYLIKRWKDSGASNPVFRDYGLSNLNEFWAVCTEVFFEQPLQFREHYPRLYKVMCKLLNQDMALRIDNGSPHQIPDGLS